MITPYLEEIGKDIEELHVKNSISAIRRTDLETNCEVLWVGLSTGPSKVLLRTFYRPPSSTYEYLTQLMMSLASIPESHTIFSLQQLVSKATRGTHTLDLLLTNDPDSISGVKVVDGLPGADHAVAWTSS